MNTDALLGFMGRYNIPSGEIEVAKWKVLNHQMTVRFSTMDQSCFGYIAIQDVEIPDGEYFIANTSTLRSLLAVLGEEHTPSVLYHAKDPAIPIALVFTDDLNTVQYALGDDRMSVKIRNANATPSPETIRVEATISEAFIKSFSKAKMALRDAPHFTIWSDGHIAELIIGYEKRTNAHRVTLGLEAPTMHTFPHTNFGNQFLYDIINANKDVKNGILQVVHIENEPPFVRLFYNKGYIQAVYIITSTAE